MEKKNPAAVAAVRPFVCHGEPRSGKPCQVKLTQAEAWVPALAFVRRALGRWPLAVKDLADHTYCGHCQAIGRRVGRKEGLRFFRLTETVVWMERRRVERQQAARQAFGRYFPKERSKATSAVGATPTASAEHVSATGQK